MNIIAEDLWTGWGRAEKTIWCVTTNGTLRKNGSVVMGRGAALELVRLVPGVDREFGEMIVQGKYPKIGTFWNYGIIFHPDRPLGILQVKLFWGDPAELILIAKAMHLLGVAARQNKTILFRVNYPGIGYGQLTKEQVASHLVGLPDNVTICYK
jgi:hypothetical protein